MYALQQATHSNKLLLIMLKVTSCLIYVICVCLRVVVSNTCWLCGLHGGCLVADCPSRVPGFTSGFWWGLCGSSF